MANYNNPKNDEANLEPNRLKGNFKVEKKTLSKRLINFLFSDKIDNIGNYLIYDILGPTLRDLLYKSVVGAAGMTIYGSVRDTGNAMERKYAGARRDYSAMARQDPDQYFAPPQPRSQYGYGIYEISFDTKDDALYRLDRLQALIAKHGKVRVKDFYDDIGYSPKGNWAIEGIGWYNLDNVTAVPTSTGRWIIDFPPPVSIRNTIY